jgi:hypothetical protein
VTLREPDGSYPSGLPNDPTFFALGEWLETVTDEAAVALDRSFGLNLYVALAHDDLAHLDAIEVSGLHLLVQADEWSNTSGTNANSVSTLSTRTVRRWCRRRRPRRASWSAVGRSGGLIERRRSRSRSSIAVTVRLPPCGGELLDQSSGGPVT